MTTALPRLYTFRRCPYAIRARMSLAYAGIDFEVREVVLRDKPPEMLALSPKGTVPVLHLADGTVLEESLDIMHWALKQADPDAWLSPDSAVQEATALLIETNDFSFKPALDGFKYPAQHPARTGHEHRDQGAVFLGDLEQQLIKSRFLFGDAIGLADVAVFPFVRQFAGVDKAWFAAAPFPHVQAWLQGFITSPLFERVMQKYAAWTPESAPVFFRAG